MPQPACVCEVAADHVAAARWSKNGGKLEAEAHETIEPGVLKPSPVDTNLLNVEKLRDSIRKVLGKVCTKGEAVALLLPDPVVRVFILPFETLPRKAADALPILRWRLKKSVPFDVENTSISWMRQTARDGSLEVISAVARLPIVREYEEAVEAAGMTPGVVLSSTLACLPLLDEPGATMLIRMRGNTLTSLIVRGSNLCVYRTSAVADGRLVDVKILADEVFPAVAYYQDNYDGELDRVLLVGFGDAQNTVERSLTADLKVPVTPLGSSAAGRRLETGAKSLMNIGQEALVGWMANGE
jgi:type IV pilus assembly protein PilM